MEFKPLQLPKTHAGKCLNSTRKFHKFKPLELLQFQAPVEFKAWEVLDFHALWNVSGCLNSTQFTLASNELGCRDIRKVIIPKAPLTKLFPLPRILPKPFLLSPLGPPSQGFSPLPGLLPKTSFRFFLLAPPSQKPLSKAFPPGFLRKAF